MMSDRSAIVVCLIGLVIVAVLLISGPEAHTHAATAEAGMGRVREAAGGVRRRAARQLTWETLQTGDSTYDNDTVFVPPGAAAVVDLKDGSRLSLEPNSLVVLTNQVFISRGSVVSESDSLTLVSDKGALQLSGQARIQVGKDTQLDVYKGSAHAGATQVSRNEGLTLGGSKRSYGSELQTPSAGQRFYGKQVHFAWTGAGKARVSTDALVHETTEHSFDLDLPPGNYTWAIFADGSLSSAVSSFAVVKDAAPRGVSPRHLELLSRTRFDAIPFVWTRTPGAQHYVLEVAADERFAVVLKTLDTTSTHAWMTADLPEGPIYWRVRAEGRDRQPVGSQLHAFRFSNAVLPDAPEVYDAEVDLGGH